MGDLKLFRIDNGTAVELQGTALAWRGRSKCSSSATWRCSSACASWPASTRPARSTAAASTRSVSTRTAARSSSSTSAAVNENVINQGLFYLDWLLDHRAEFELLVMKKLGHRPAEQIDWSGPRLVCVASDFTRYDEHAIAQINRSIELVRYRDYDGAFLTLDLVASTSATATCCRCRRRTKPTRRSSEKTVTQLHEQAPEDLRNLYDALEAYLLSLGDDVTKTDQAALLRLPPDQELRVRRDPSADQEAARLPQDRPEQHHPGAWLHPRRDQDRPLRDRQSGSGYWGPG